MLATIQGRGCFDKDVFQTGKAVIETIFLCKGRPCAYVCYCSKKELRLTFRLLQYLHAIETLFLPGCPNDICWKPFRLPSSSAP
jgi:hypothetical protein